MIVFVNNVHVILDICEIIKHECRDEPNGSCTVTKLFKISDI